MFQYCELNAKRLEREYRILEIKGTEYLNEYEKYLYELRSILAHFRDHCEPSILNH